MRRILCLHMPYLPTERVQRDAVSADKTPPPSQGGAGGGSKPPPSRPAELGKELQPSRSPPPLVLTRTVGAAQVVECVCPRAQQRGLRPGMSLGQAQAMLPELHAAAHEPARDRAALERLATWAIRFSPLVEPLPPSTLLLDVTGCELLFGGEKQIVRRAADGLTQLGFSARAAIADTVGAAYALAYAAADPLTVAPPGQTSAALAPLPPAALRIDAQTDQRLDALGVRTIGDLLMLPRSSLPARFGPELGLRLRQALGETFEGLAPHEPDERPVTRRRFEVPVADWNTIQSVAEELLREVFAQVVQRGETLRRLECILYFEDAAPRVLSIRLARASREPRHVAQLLTLRLEPVDLTPGIIGLMLVARETSRYRGGQGDLFEPRDPGDDEAFGGLIDRLAGRLGHAALVRPQLVDDHQPEMAFRYVSVAEAGCEAQDAKKANAQPPSLEGRGRGRVEAHGVVDDFALTADTAMPPKRRPVRLLPRPLLVRAIALLPDGPPTWFAYQAREYHVAAAAGPERIETAWWRGRDVRRDYFRVTVETGEQFWLFRATDEQRWYLHGLFA